MAFFQHKLSPDPGEKGNLMLKNLSMSLTSPNFYRKASEKNDMNKI